VRVKLPEREADNMPQSSAEVNKARNFTSIPSYAHMTWSNLLSLAL